MRWLYGIISGIVVALVLIFAIMICPGLLVGWVVALIATPIIIVGGGTYIKIRDEKKIEEEKKAIAKIYEESRNR